ncbi:MAG: uroporphyrinogen decarboxylase family protein [Candidatus Sigynarchaeum springense]
MDPDARVLAALDHVEPDRVPAYEGAIEIPEIVGSRPVNVEPGILFYPAALLRYMAAPWARPLRKLAFAAIQRPRAIATLLQPVVAPVFGSISSVYRRLRVDLMGAAGGLPVVLSPRLFDDIRVLKHAILAPAGDVATGLPSGHGAVDRRGFLRSIADYDKYMAFDADSIANTCLARKLIEFGKGRIALAFTVFGAAYFEHLCEMFGYETLFRLLVKEPGFIKRAVKDMSDYAVAVATRLLDNGARIFYMTDDLGQKQRPLISPAMYRRYFKQGVSRFCKAVHAGGGKVMLHSDGCVLDLVPDFIEAGIDALHPWEGSAGMDIAEGKRRWGDKLTLVGNVPVELLSHGTPTGVDAHVTRLIRDVAPGGGFIISSSHSVIPTCKYENYRAYVLARVRDGRYPIR